MLLTLKILVLMYLPVMIETEFFILTQEQYDEFSQCGAIEGVTLDYYLSEFCDVQGPNISSNK